MNVCMRWVRGELCLSSVCREKDRDRPEGEREGKVEGGRGGTISHFNRWNTPLTHTLLSHKWNLLGLNSLLKLVYL